MKGYSFLLGAIFSELLGTLLLPVSQNFTKIFPTVVLISSYVLSVYLLTFALKELPLAIVYSSWAGLGVFTVALFSYVFYEQTLTWQAVLGLFLIVTGVTLVNVYKAQ